MGLYKLSTIKNFFMEYLTLLDYLYVISSPLRKKSIHTISFFLPHNLTVLNNLFTLKKNYPNVTK
ncbi:hypothetical protein HDF26_002598 [Pedobacter cryoconitis]|uniref:Uncharacterized protein n=1 Tax=Pedobacter cryoconitis TaxID=188932 RepID=A0A7W8ZIT2_9SPHI|nr:hypothetical protein [Pedobacter cryoconitis]MBB6272141.1 hypothetical protein [Pedobacter cryoconitis]